MKFIGLSPKAMIRRELYEEVSAPGSHKTILVGLQDLPFFIELLKIETTMKVIVESSFTTHYGMETTHDNFLNQKINRKIIQFVEVGLMDYWKNKHEPKPKEMLEMGPKILTVEHLAIGFKIWLVCISLSLVAFLIEFVGSKISKGCDWSRK